MLVQSTAVAVNFTIITITTLNHAIHNARVANFIIAILYIASISCYFYQAMSFCV